LQAAGGRREDAPARPAATREVVGVRVVVAGHLVQVCDPGGQGPACRGAGTADSACASCIDFTVIGMGVGGPLLEGGQVRRFASARVV